MDSEHPIVVAATPEERQIEIVGNIAKDIFRGIHEESMRSENIASNERVALKKEEYAHQQRVRADKAAHLEKLHAKNVWLYGAVTVLVIALIAYAMHLHNDEMARMLVSVIVSLVAGGAAGYSLGMRRRADDEPEG